MDIPDAESKNIKRDSLKNKIKIFNYEQFKSKGVQAYDRKDSLKSLSKSMVSV